MEEQKPKDNLLPLSGVVALVIALGAIFYSLAPLKGTRPSIPEVREELSPKVRARLWQDPFRAVLDNAKTSGKKAEECSAEVCDIKGTLCEKEAKKRELANKIAKRLENGAAVTILSVMVFGGPHAEDMESRIRHRYAVLSGLLRLDFLPEDPEHISYLKTDHKAFSLQNILPYEWVKNGKDYVLILWINNESFLWKIKEKKEGGEVGKEDVFGKQLCNLKCLFDNLHSKNIKNKPAFKIIGPAGSANLVEMMKELKLKENIELIGDSLKGLEIYTATATAADWLLLSEGKNQTKILSGCREDAGKIDKLFKEKPFEIKFNRQICTDDLLAKDLIGELYLRDVDLLSGQRDHVVLVAESDTFFGWSLPRTFEKVLNDMRKKECQKDDVKNLVHHYSYLRGLDGKVPGEQEREAKELKKNDSDRKEEEELQRSEEPAGKSQYDYLRRLAERINRLNHELKRNRQGSIKAIGVLGSDFYDKYLVLQALGPWFPDIVFFTTDLDARFLYSPYNKYMRNLVVASGFCLQLREDLQGSIPPFRDTHQTSLFLATLRAFADTPSNVLKAEDLTQDLQPRIFEIGRTQAVDLTKGEPAPNAGSANNSHKANSIHPQPHKLSLKDLKPIHLLYLIVFLIIILILYQSKTNVRDKMRRIGGLLHEYWYLPMIFIILIFLFDWFILQDTSQEPFSWSEGVSAWPTEILRILSIILAWLFFFAASKRLETNNAEIVKEFGLKNELVQPANEFPNTWSQYLKMARYYWWRNNEEPPDPDNTDKKIDMDDLWQEYQNRGDRLYRFLRVIPFAIVIACVVILSFVSLYRPIRGNLSRNLDVIILLVTIFSFYSLTFFVFDNTRLCRRFVNLMIIKSKAQWSEKSLEQFIRKVGRAKEDLKDLMFVRLIAKRTEAVGKQILYPFIVLVIIIIARSHYFDNWRLPFGLLAFIAILSLSYTWSCAVTLRRQAERTRIKIIDRLSQKLIQAIEDDPHQPRVEQLQFVLNEIKSTQSGAFAPFTQQPLVRALLVPFGGIGGLHLLNFLAR